MRGPVCHGNFAYAIRRRLHCQVISGLAMVCVHPSLHGLCSWHIGSSVPRGNLRVSRETSRVSLHLLTSTYRPVILVSKASELRRLTRNWGIHAKQEEVEVDLKELAVKNIARPLRILFTEPIVLLITIYSKFWSTHCGMYGQLH